MKIREYRRNGVRRFQEEKQWVQVFPAREPADQRSDHPDQAQGQVEPPEPGHGCSVPAVLPNADPRGGHQPAVRPRRPETNRDDLVAVLLTGVPGLNNTGPTLADMLRINLSIPPTASPSRLGVFGGDLAGFPNGRRLTDDVVDIAERAVAGS